MLRILDEQGVSHIPGLHSSRSNTDVALKILTADCTSGPHPLDELGTLQFVKSANPNHPGYSYIQHLLDHFTIEGPNGTHVCLVLERLRDSVDMLWRDEDGVRRLLPTDFVRNIARDVLMALTYLHEECRLIHTGNIVFLYVHVRSSLTRLRCRYQTGQHTAFRSTHAGFR